MTIASTAARDTHTGDGSTATFAYNFTIHYAKHLAVWVGDSDDTDNVRKTLNLDYTVTGVGVSAGGTIVFNTNSIPASGEKITILLDKPFSQDTDYSSYHRLPMQTHERALDFVTQQDKVISERAGRSLILPTSTSISDGSAVLPTPAAGYVLKWNSGGTALENASSTDTYSLASVQADTSPALGGALDANAYNVKFDDDSGFTDDSGNEQMRFNKTASAVNQFEITNNTTGNAAILSIAGDDANTDLVLSAKGTGQIKVNNGLRFATTKGFFDSNTNEQLLFNATGSAVNQFEVTNAATATDPILSATGGDTNIDVALQAKGTGTYSVLGTSTLGATVRLYEDTDNGTNYVALKAPAAVTSPWTFNFLSTDGTASQGFSTDGAGTLQWVTVGTDPYSHVSTVTISGATASAAFTGLTTAASYMIVCNNVIPATDGAILRARISTDGGSTYKTTGYVVSNFPILTVNLTTTTTYFLASSGGFTSLDVDSGTTGGACSYLMLYNPASSATFCRYTGQGVNPDYGTPTAAYYAKSGGIYGTAGTAVDAIQFSFSSGDISSGKFHLYKLSAS